MNVLLRIYAVVTLLCLISPVYGQVKFCAVGDVLFDRGVRKTIKKHGVNYLFEEVKSIISSHDLSFCNLECPLTTSKIGYPLNKRYSFRCDPESVKGLCYVGFNVVSVANNHTIDWGRNGFLETIRILKKNGIYPIGGGINQKEAMKPVLIKKNGLTFAFFGAIDFLLEAIPFLDDKPAPAYAGIEELTAQIRKINNQVDFVIVSFHWGIENHTLPTSRQVEYAHRVIDAGADLVLGHHPHVLQGFETYKDRLIIYSLGNFVFNNSMPEQMQTVIFSCEFDKGRILFPKIIPIIIQHHQPKPAAKSHFHQIVKRIKKLSKGFSTKFTVSDDAVCFTSENGNRTTTVPIKEWKLQEREIRVYASRLELTDLRTDSTIILPIKNMTLSLKDACLVQDNQIAYVYAILGNLQEKRGKQLAIFPIELKKNRFKTPLLDSHKSFNPWKIRAGDVDGDGNPEILVGVWKTTRYHQAMDNRLFVFNRYGDVIYPKWLGSRLGRPFIDFEAIDLDGDCKNELITLETVRPGDKQVTAYKWNRFGFNEYEILETNYIHDCLLYFLNH